jgi:hypothetical protein
MNADSSSLAVAAAPASAPMLLTIHVCRGKFMVWQPEGTRHRRSLST